MGKQMVIMIIVLKCLKTHNIKICISNQVDESTY